ncbi:Hypothetical predicted protein [Mytilus galloprovincialis]|uniref:B box-type domain-containing protein n=1 Tax=Mytilus galloprovincialis TaxID=29158 RepID=A0A8B6HEN2_MYTGA|nr:Hypothetical predicted protein [Mytilus galloprovincialis]
MAVDITRRSEPTSYCRLHTKETYQLYCKDCQDFVCFVCFGEFHEKYVFCRFQDVEEDIRNQFSMLFSENDNCIKRMDKFRQIIDQNIRQLSEDEGLKSIFKTYQLSSEELTIRVENIRTQVTKFNHVNAEKLPEYKLEEIINVLSELKACDIGCEELKQYQKPKFNTDVKYGIEKFEAEVFEPILYILNDASFCVIPNRES